MKNLILFMLLIGITSCDFTPIKYPIVEYSIYQQRYVPDSLKPDMRKWITETVRAATNNISTEDYEDIDDTIEQAEESAYNIFSVNVYSLRKEMRSRSRTDIIYINPESFDDYEKQMFDSLRYGYPIKINPTK